ncbi:MAG: tetratricopeptide repeat protein [Flavobacteriales bacterium]|nr:tetratricopeptide repeat protein [Flavobacteriales bacterium]
MRILFFILFVVSTQIGFSQSNKEKAKLKAQDAIRLVDNGQFALGIKMLEEAMKLDPDNIDYPYEIAYAKYASKDYEGAVKILEKVKKKKDATDQFYQLLGNSYDMLGKSDKALKTYADGMKRFPKSGKLYLETGIVYLNREDYDNAIKSFEDGVKTDPTYSSNYYWLARMFLNSSEEVWGMIYGELFINLERNTKRTTDISKLLYKTYLDKIKIENDTTYKIGFGSNITINMDQLKDPDNFKLPFPMMVYSPVMSLAVVGEKSIDIHSLDRIRKRFNELFYEMGHDKNYPNVLFDYQREMIQAGHMEAYNHWLLLAGDEAGFTEWKDANQAKWGKFVEWYNNNSIPINEDYYFLRNK